MIRKLVITKLGVLPLIIEKLNKETEYTQYPMSVIDDIMHSLPAVNFMTTLDLTSGYHHIAMKYADVEKTAFICKAGAFAFFSTSMASATLQEHMDKLEKAFEQLKGAVLTVNIDKCTFLWKELKYLVYQFTQAGIYTDDSKIAAVKNYSIPPNAKQ